MYLSNLRNPSVCGVKYLEFGGENEVRVTCRGGAGKVCILLDSEMVAEIYVEESKQWKTRCARIKEQEGVHAVYIQFFPDNEAMDFRSFQFSRTDE